MSRKALAIACVAQLMEAASADKPGLGLTRKLCGLAPLRGQPPASVGERYVGIWVGSRVADTPSAGLRETYTVNATITYRFNGRVPVDRLGQSLMDSASEGMDDFADAVRLCFHGDLIDNRVIERANAIIDSDGGPFVTALQFLGDDDPYPVGPQWFWAEDDTEDGDSPLCGMVQNLRFGKCDRVQSYTSTQGVS